MAQFKSLFPPFPGLDLFAICNFVLVQIQLKFQSSVYLFVLFNFGFSDLPSTSFSL